MAESKKTIFISCGQRTEEEKKLGTSIVNLVRELTPHEPYFAEYQTSLEGLSKNIFDALNQCIGLIAVMHQRGRVEPQSVIRASVWVEQEIAIAAFLRSSLGRHIYAAAYLQPDIALEGVRQQLLLNPRVFYSNDDVLNDLRKVLPSWKAPAETEGTEDINISIEYEKIRITQERHDYRLVVLLTNHGKETLDNYHVDLEFPTELIAKPKDEYHYVGTRSTASKSFFRATQQQIGLNVFPGDILRVITLPYYVDNDIFINKRHLLKENAKVTVYFKGKELLALKNISQLQIF